MCYNNSNWACTCGNVNTNFSDTCPRCGRSRYVVPMDYFPDPCSGCSNRGKGPCFCARPAMMNPYTIYKWNTTSIF